MKIKEFTASYKRTVPIQKEYYSMSFSLTVDLEGVEDEKEQKKEIKAGWEKAQQEVEDQFINLVDIIKQENK